MGARMSRGQSLNTSKIPSPTGTLRQWTQPHRNRLRWVDNSGHHIRWARQAYVCNMHADEWFNPSWLRCFNSFILEFSYTGLQPRANMICRNYFVKCSSALFMILTVSFIALSCICGNSGCPGDVLKMFLEVLLHID